jgi:hypothetical protein
VAFCQSTTLSGQVTDTGSQSWNNGTITATLRLNPGYPSFPSYTWTGGILNPTISGTLNASGAYSISLPSNSAIVPGGTQWLLTVSPQASPTNAFSLGPITVAGATQTQNITPPAILINLSTAVPPVSAYSTVEVTGAALGSEFFLIGGNLQICAAVSGNICTTWIAAGGGGSSFPVTTPVAVNAGGSITVNSGGSIAPAGTGTVTANLATASVFNSGANVITAEQLLTPVSRGGFGVLFDVTAIPDGSTTSGSNIVTCPNADCKFLTGPHPALVGEIFFSNVGNGISCEDNADILFGGTRQTTITSVDSDTQIHVVGNSGTTTVAIACMAWGHDDTTALNTAWATGGCIASLWLPGGLAFISAPVFQIISGCPSVASAGTAFQGQRVWGQSVTGTYLVPVPNFNFSSITGTGGPACTPSCTGAIGNENISDYENMAVWGLGDRCSSTLANTTLWLLGSSARAINTSGVGWCARGGGASLIGVNVSAAGDIYNYGGLNYFGSVEISFAAGGGTTDFKDNVIQGTGQNVGSGCVIIAQPGSNVLAANDAIIGQTCIGSLGAGAAAVWTSESGFYDSFVDVNVIVMGQNSVFNSLANDSLFHDAATNEGAILFGSGGSTGATFRAHAATMVGVGTVAAVTGASGNTFSDEGGNTYSNGSEWNGLGTWNVVGLPLFVGKGTGVCTSASTLFLYPAGQTTAQTCTVTVESLLGGQGVVSQVGNIHNLRCTSTAGGVNASSGVVTVRKNGVNTALTATFGTGTLAVDSTFVHLSPVAFGDVITYSLTTQAAETLAGVTCQVQVN